MANRWLQIVTKSYLNKEMLVNVRNMANRDTVVYRITIETRDELERIRKIISKEMGIDINLVKHRHAEAALRLKAKRGELLQNELQDILLGKIK